MEAGGATVAVKAGIPVALSDVLIASQVHSLTFVEEETWDT